MAVEEESVRKHHVLVVDDEPAFAELVRQSLQNEGFRVDLAHDAALALESAEATAYHAVLADLRLGEEDGLELCQQLASRQPGLPVVAMTAFGSMHTAVAALRAGAYDFVTKPLQFDALALIMQRASQHGQLLEELGRLRRGTAQSTAATGRLIGNSAAMRRVYQLVARLGPSDASVLITGDSGTGKELVAQAIHAQSDRRDGEFVAVNCAAVPGHLLESELFGHAKGAFTDARGSRPGLFQRAKGGTLLLDEIGELPLEMQPKLLRALQ